MSSLNWLNGGTSGNDAVALRCCDETRPVLGLDQRSAARRDNFCLKFQDAESYGSIGLLYSRTLASEPGRHGGPAACEAPEGRSPHRHGESADG